MSKAIVFGASGQLGQCLKTVADSRDIDFLIFPDEKEANILDVAALEKLFEPTALHIASIVRPIQQ